MKKFLAAVGLILVAACTWTSPQANFYSLKSIAAPEADVRKTKFSVGVAPAIVPDYLDKPQMVMREQNGVELRISELNRWGEPLSGMIQRVLADDLALLLPGAWVKPEYHGRENFTYIVYVEINRFDGGSGGEAVLDCWWSVRNASGSVVRRQRESFIQPMGQGYENMAEAQSILLSRLAARIAGVIR